MPTIQRKDLADSWTLAKGSILEMQNNTTIAVMDKIYEGGGVVGYVQRKEA